jgi:hypothetical protein
MMPNSEFQPIMLGENVFYLSTMDSVAVAMEASVISAKNAVKMINKMRR